ncbi:MAG TPA: glycosyltransferase [Pseudolabrys sp.]|nr:glycosyltransferase [Pseudolabrys sp.]
MRTALKNIDLELIFVDDDSSDGTVDVARSIGVRDARIRCIRRVGRRGLSSACLEGILAGCIAHRRQRGQ